MPQITLSYANENEIPAELKQYKTADNKVVIWAGDKVAEETNPALETKKNEILGEKKNLEIQYNALLKSSSVTDQEKARILADNERLKNSTVAPEDAAILKTVKSIDPAANAQTLKERLEKLQTVETELSTYKSREKNSKLFGLSGFGNETVFQTVLNNKEFNPNLIEAFPQSVTENGAAVEKLYAKVKNADGTEKVVTFDEYVKSNANWSPFLPALGAQQQQGGKTWLNQQSSAGSGGTGPGTQPKIAISAVIDNQNKAAAEKPNPLLDPPVQPKTQQ